MYDGQGPVIFCLNDMRPLAGELLRQCLDEQEVLRVGRNNRDFYIRIM